MFMPIIDKTTKEQKTTSAPASIKASESSEGSFAPKPMPFRESVWLTFKLICGASALMGALWMIEALISANHN